MARGFNGKQDINALSRVGCSGIHRILKDPHAYQKRLCDQFQPQKGAQKETAPIIVLMQMKKVVVLSEFPKNMEAFHVAKFENVVQLTPWRVLKKKNKLGR